MDLINFLNKWDEKSRLERIKLLKTLFNDSQLERFYFHVKFIEEALSKEESDVFRGSVIFVFKELEDWGEDPLRFEVALLSSLLALFKG